MTDYSRISAQVAADVHEAWEIKRTQADWYSSMTVAELAALVAAERRDRRDHPPTITTWFGVDINSMSEGELRTALRDMCAYVQDDHRRGRTFLGTPPGPNDRD